MYEIKKGLELKADIENRTFKGYAAIFDTVDSHRDIIRKGAFLESIAAKHRPSKNSFGIKVFLNHSTAIGIPLELYEDSKGLYCEGKISKTRLGDEALELIGDRVIDQMSIGFNTLEEMWIDPKFSKLGEDREILKIDLWEISPVVWGSNQDTEIALKKREKKSLFDSIEKEAKEEGIKTEEVKSNIKFLDHLAIKLDLEARQLENFLNSIKGKK